MRDSLIAVKSITLIENFYVSRRGYSGATATDFHRLPFIEFYKPSLAKC